MPESHEELPMEQGLATGSTDKTLKLHDGHFHDLLNDLDK